MRVARAIDAFCGNYLDIAGVDRLPARRVHTSAGREVRIAAAARLDPQPAADVDRLTGVRIHAGPAARPVRRGTLDYQIARDAQVLRATGADIDE